MPFAVGEQVSICSPRKMTKGYGLSVHFCITICSIHRLGRSFADIYLASNTKFSELKLNYPPVENLLLTYHFRLGSPDVHCQFRDLLAIRT